MKTDLPTINSTQDKVSVWYLNQDKIFDYSPSLTLKQFKAQLNEVNGRQKTIFYDWEPVNDFDQTMTLSDVIQKSQNLCPSQLVKDQMFTAIDQNELLLKFSQNKQTRISKILSKLQEVQQVDDKNIPKVDISATGNVMFQGRQAALFASSIKMALQKADATPKLQTFLQSNQLKGSTSEAKLSTIGEFFKKIGLIESKAEEHNENYYIKLAETLKISKQFSNLDPKFVYYIIPIYLKFMAQSKGKLQYIDYRNVEDFQTDYISPKSKIGIIGDYGTGLKDSIELMKNMILKHNVDVIFHLGDVYYAGTPQQYEVSIIKPLNELRLQTKREIRFYAIPGNHDYYSWGLPYLCFVKGINQKEFQKQKASYFCIRDQEQKWQFLGMDSAFYDSNPFNQVYPGGVGPFVQQKEILWHKHRLQNFKGSTVLMTHHQLFSIHERINGRLTKYRKFSCINPVLYSSMFKYMSNISAWFWGHEHSLMLFKDNLFGLSKARLLGNSSFHMIYNVQNPYTRQKGFPMIPFIVEDKEYFNKYLPVHPTLPDNEYFALSYGLIDMEKIDKEGNLSIEYWCCPCFSNQKFENKDNLSAQERKRFFFEEYRLYEQKLLSIQTLKKERKPIKTHTNVYLRCEIGLALKLLKEQKQQNLLKLNLSGTEFEIQFIDEKSISGHQIFEFSLKLTEKLNNDQLYVGVVNNEVKLVNINSKEDLLKNNALWTCENLCSSNDAKENQRFIFERQSVKIHNKTLQKSLTWKIDNIINNDAFPILQEPQYPLTEQGLKIERFDQENLECLWMFETQKIISEQTV